MSKKSKKVIEVQETETFLNTLPSKSAKIRYLQSIGWGRRTIADYLGIRYQHVRNVEVTLLKKDMNK